MGHYASEMDPNWGKLSYAEQKIQAVEDPQTQWIASYLNSQREYRNAYVEHDIRFAKFLESYIDSRIATALEAERGA